MAEHTLRYLWTWDMPAPPAQVWPLVSDTHSFNRSVGTGPWTFTETPDPDGGSVREGASRTPLGTITWDENPFHWVKDREFSVLRVFHRGPLKHVLARLELEPAAAGSTLTYSIEAVPRSAIWTPVTRYYLGVQSRRRFNRTFTRIAEHLAGTGQDPYTHSRSGLPRHASDRLSEGAASLAAAGLDGDLVGRLTEFIEHASEDECSRLRPYALAEVWSEDRETVLRLFLHATRLGLLELTWDLMCPLCRGAKTRLESLSGLRSQGHCDSCNIRFDTNFDRAVEVSFRTSHRVRPVEEESYCVGGPWNTPHVLLQREVSPGETYEATLELVPGEYRLRGPRLKSTALVDVEAGGEARGTLSFTFDESGLEPSRTSATAGAATVTLRNGGDEPHLVMLERMEWAGDAATAAEVTALQEFRDLFSSQILDPEEQFQVSYLAFLFTDLKASTALYREQGDAPAYALVRDHFQVLRERITKHHGAIVKTIGDAVMAVFREPADAVATGLDLHHAVRDPGTGRRELTLKVGIHAGPCIAVNLNGRLDYFGTTVNTAVRLQERSQGGDVVVHSDLMEDPGVRALLDSESVDATRESADLKGYDEPVGICRLRRPAATLQSPEGGVSSEVVSGTEEQ